MFSYNAPVVGRPFFRTLVTGEHFAVGGDFEYPYSWKIVLDVRLQIKSDYSNKHSKALTRVKGIGGLTNGNWQVKQNYHIIVLQIMYQHLLINKKEQMMDNRKMNALIQSEFQLDNDIYYLNHAAVSPLPARSGLALKAFADENVHQGALEYPNWMVIESRLRQRLASLTGSPSVDDIALTKNTSEALSFVAHGFPWKNGDNVVISNEEFPSNRVVWQSLATIGVTVRQVSLRDVKDPEQALIDACDKHTRLLSISSVQYASGLKMDLEKLGLLCKKHNIAFCVDAIQGLGVMPHHVQEMNIDFLMADGHKWMLGAEGLAVFYCSEKWRSLMRLHEFGWHMTDNYHDFDATDWRPADSARCFECGSPNILGTIVLDASLSLIEEVTVSRIESLILEKSEYLFDRINQSPALELITNNSEGRYAGIVVFRHKQKDSKTLYESLMKHKVVCAHRGGGIRFSPHFYTSNDVLDKAIKLVLSV